MGWRLLDGAAALQQTRFVQPMRFERSKQGSCLQCMEDDYGSDISITMGRIRTSSIWARRQNGRHEECF